MKESLWGYYLIFLGVIIVIIMILISNIVTTNQQDYYLLREVTNAAMLDAVDYSYYKKYGEMRINTEKFVEIFLRRFSQSVTKNNSYKIEMYSIFESPPSVSIKISSGTGEFYIAGDTTNINVVNSYDAILESNNNIFIDEAFKLYSLPYGNCSEEQKYNGSYCKMTNKVPLEFKESSEVVQTIKRKVDNYYKNNKIDKNFNINKIKISDVHYLEPINNDEDIIKYKEKLISTYNYKNNTGDVNKINYKNDITSKDYLSKNIDNVKITIVNDDNGKTYLAYGLDYNCDNTNKFGQDENKDPVKQYRKKFEGTIKEYLETPSQYISPSEYNSLPESEKKLYEWTPYYDNCLVGIKYKVDFYYDYS